MPTTKTMLPSDPAAPTGTPGRAQARRPPIADVLGLLLSCSFVVVAFFPIIFGGRTLSTASNGVTGSNGFSPFPGQPMQRHALDFRIDRAASVWQFEPWAQINHRAYTHGQLPLWNPYQGAGSPLAANLQSAPFDPLLLPVNLHPTARTWDFAIIGAFVLGAAATFLFARVLGLETVGAVAASAAFSLSGYFFVYSNNHFSRSYIYLPILFLFVELVIRSRHRWAPLGLGLAIAGNIYLGMPEISGLVLGASAGYAAVRLVQERHAIPPRPALLRLLGGAAFGLLLAAPLLLLFQQYVSISFNSHRSGSGAGSQPLRVALNWVVPFLNGDKTQPTGGTVYDWCGAAVAVLALVGLSGRRETRRLHGWLFFAGAALVLAMLSGLPVFSSFRHLPGISRINLLAYGAPVAGFALAMLGGIGVHVLWRRDLHLRRFSLLFVIGVTLFALIAITGGHLHQLVSASTGTSLGGWMRAILAGAAVLVATYLIAQRRAALAAVLACAAIVVELISLAPQDIYATRANQFAAPGWLPLVQNVMRREPDARILGLDGKLYPDTAAAFGLQDVRVVDGLYVERYWRFVRTFIEPAAYDRFDALTNGLSTRSTQPYAGNPVLDPLAVRVILKYVPLTSAAPPTPNGLRLVGRDLDTLVYENLRAYPRAWVVHQAHEVGSENAAFSFLRSRGRVVQGVVSLDRLDLRREAVVEGSGGPALRLPARGASCDGAADRVSVGSYTIDSVTLKVQTACRGVVVLPDTYFPGWTATVNGHEQHVYPTDGAFRGVPVGAGTSLVEFRFQPARFRVGVILALLALVAAPSGLAAVVWSRRRAARRAT